MQRRAGGVLLPGYGWIFGIGDGTSNVGLGILNTSAAFGHVDYKDILSRWVDTLPPEWTFQRSHDDQPGPRCRPAMDSTVSPLRPWAAVGR